TVEKAGPPPVEPLSLVERGEPQCEPEAGVQETHKTRSGPRFTFRWPRWNSAIDAENHDRRNEGRNPEHPVKGKMAAQGSIDGRGRIHRRSAQYLPRRLRRSHTGPR